MMVDIENPQIQRSRPERPELEVSPTLTTVASAEGSPRGMKCTIEHQVTTKKSKGIGTNWSFLRGMSKPLAALVTTTVLASTGSVAWLFTKWLAIPGLEEQIHALEEQVHLLAHENNRYSYLNSQLNETSMEYQLLSIQLNDSTAELSHLNQQLSHSNAVFANLNAELHNENQEYASLNADLNATTQGLYGLNEDLMTVVSFLNETTSHLQYSFDALINHLADQIAINEVILLETLRNTYLQRIQSWDCSYQDYFLTEEFVQHRTHPIGDMLPEVLDYVDERLLAGLCLDNDNLELFLEDTVNSPESITSSELIQGVTRYAMLASDYYFPVATSFEGVDRDDWAIASYRCSNLERPFFWR